MVEPPILTNLTQELRNPNFLEKLLYAPETPPNLADENLDVQWEAIPYYLPTKNPRLTYRMQTANGDYLLKLNTKTIQIQREGAICHLLHTRKLFPLAVPHIVDMETCVKLEESASCGWLLAEWVNGHPISKIEQDQFTRLFAQSLLNLHTVPITKNIVESLFAVSMPSMEKALAILRERRMESFDKALKVCGEKLLPFISRLRKQVESCSFAEYIAINHGDLHAYNMKLERTSDRDKLALFLFDWEDITLDHPLNDLANFMFNEKYSERALDSLKIYVHFYNQKCSGNDTISALEAWLLTSVWFVRNLHWRFHTTSIKERKVIEREAMQTMDIIQEGIFHEKKLV